MNSTRPRIFYGWLIVFVSAVGQFLGPPLLVFSFSVFFKSLAEDFHASRAAVSFAFSLSNTVGALWILGAGPLIDRFGAKRVILLSTFVYAVALCSPLWVGSRLWQLYLVFAVLGAAMASGTAPVSYGVVISHWFNRYRGFALGLSNMGIGVGSVVVPIVAQRLIAIFGWRVAFAIFGGAVLLLPLPILAAFLQNDPAERGLLPDGDQNLRGANLRGQNKQGMTWHEIWHTPTFWMMICIFSLVGASVHGAVLHLSAIFTDRGVSAERAAAITALVGVAVSVGRLGSGYLLDRVFAPRVAIVFYSGTALGLAILWAGSSGHFAVVASFLIGLGMGSEVETMGYMIGRYFGLLSFGTAYGYVFGAFMISGSVGVLMMGMGYDHFHSYTVPLACFLGAILLALILLTRLGRYRYGVEDAVSGPMNSLEVSSGA
jgi:MFS family permease